MPKALFVIASSMSLLCASATMAANPMDVTRVDWRIWQSLPVQNGGRIKPLDTVATEGALLMSNQASVVDSQTNQALNPCQIYLTMLFEWSGWDHRRKDELLSVQDVASQYSFFHQSDRWDKTPLLHIEQLALKQMLGLPEHVALVPPATLAQTSLVNPRTQKSIPFPTWGKSLRDLKDSGKQLTPIEEGGLELADQLELFQSQRMGLTIGIVPSSKADDNSWLSLAELMIAKFDETTDVNGTYRQAQKLLWQTRTDFSKGDATAFNNSSAAFCDALQAILASTPQRPNQVKVNLEVAYNHWKPISYLPLCMLLAVIGSLLHLRTSRLAFHKVALVTCGFGTGTLLLGLAMRAVISGNLPATTMYETVLLVAAGIAVLGLVLGSRQHRPYVLALTAAISLLALSGANYLGGPSASSLRILEPVLRSNTLLALHVVTITLSFAAFALAMGLANAMLACLAAQKFNRDLVDSLTHLISRSIQIGIALLACGIAFGCIWADTAWGHFWSWDPKEIWSLIALSGYFAVFHAWNTGAIGHRGLAALSASCFTLVVIAWYGVNVAIGVGQHSYGFGSGGQPLVYGAILLQFLYTGTTLHRIRDQEIMLAVGTSNLQTSAKHTQL